MLLETQIEKILKCHYNISRKKNIFYQNLFIYFKCKIVCDMGL